MIGRWAALVLLLLMPAIWVQAVAFDHEHSVWTDLLQQHVTNDGGLSQVDYRALLDEEAKLSVYLESLSRVSHQEFAGWTEDQRRAFLINAYNGSKDMDRYPLGIGTALIIDLQAKHATAFPSYNFKANVGLKPSKFKVSTLRKMGK